MSRLLKNYIDGEWKESPRQGTLDDVNPSTEEILCQVPLSTQAAAEDAIRAAHHAFTSWSQTSVTARTAYIFKLRELINNRLDYFSELIVRDMGKSLADANAEMKRCLQNIEMACGMPYLIKGYKVASVAAGIDTDTVRQPVGVFGIVCPFNFPTMVPFWFIPYALAAGNTVIVKPSELTPLCLEAVFNIIAEIKFPPGVINLVHGDKTVVDTLVESPLVQGISFVGSSTVAQKIYRNCAAKGKRCQAMGSAKNYLVIMPDADIESTIGNMLTSCFGCAGQRCMAASVAACIGDETYQVIKEKFTAAAAAIEIGNPLLPSYRKGAFVMGPVISRKARERITACIEHALQQGAVALLDGRKAMTAMPTGYFMGPTILEHVAPGSNLERTEVFGPVVALIKFKNLGEAIRAINEHPYGNAASLYTRSGYDARKFELETNCGMIGINVGVPAPMPYFPFGGTKASMFSDIKAQGARVIDFFTEEKIITRRFPE